MNLCILSYDTSFDKSFRTKYNLSTTHNIAFYLRLVGEARSHILAGDFKAWKQEAVVRLTRRL